MIQENDNTEKRPSMVACPKCKRTMTDIVKRLKGGRLLLKNSICDCGYSLRAVEIPKAPLISKA